MSKDKNEMLEALGELTSAVRAIAHGTVSAPGGLEGLAIAVAGPGLGDPLSDAVRDGLSDIASAISEGFDSLAAAVRGETEES